MLTLFKQKGRLWQSWGVLLKKLEGVLIINHSHF